MVLSDSAERFMRRLPVLFSLCLFGSTWVLFVFFVSIKQVLLVRHETWRFVMQIVVFNTLAILSLVSYIVAVSRHPLRPDQTFAPPDARPLLPDEVRPPPSPSGRSRSQSPRPEGRNGDHVDDDDIPLRLLRTARQESNTGSALTHRDHSPSRSHHGDEYDDGLDVHESHALLGKPEQDGDGAPDVDTTPIMAKGATGGPRWCRKCDGWKPDRCHHCRSCMQCVLKMDHHCPWLDNCVGYHNYKPFILFLTYCTLLCVFGAWQTGIEVYRFFKNPVEFERGPATNVDEMDELKFALMPVVWMVLTILAFVFGIAVGGMCGYHWYLLLNNRTTLEDMNRSVPTALLDPATRAVLEELGPRGSRNRLPGAWRPDHILTRPERTRLRSEAREINVYDVGWSRNLRSVMCGDGAPPVHTFRALLQEVRRAAWPLARPRTRQYGAGHFFEHDPAALQQLKALTSEMRLGLGEDAPSSRQQQTHHLGEWTIGHSDSDSEDE